MREPSRACRSPAVSISTLRRHSHLRASTGCAELAAATPGTVACGRQHGRRQAGQRRGSARWSRRDAGRAGGQPRSAGDRCGRPAALHQRIGAPSGRSRRSTRPNSWPRAGNPLRCTARGTVLGERTTLALRAGVLPQMLREPATPIELQLAAAGATAHVEGIARTTRYGTRQRPRVPTRRAARRRPRTLAGFRAGVEPADRAARSRARRQRVASRGHHPQAGPHRVDRGRAPHARHGRPIIVVAVRSPLIDVPELQTLRPKSADAPPPSFEAWLDMPILPQGVHLAAADIGFGLARVVLGRTELADVGFSAHIRDGRLSASPFAARFAGVSFEGFASARLARRSTRGIAVDVHRQRRRRYAVAHPRCGRGYRRPRRRAASQAARPRQRPARTAPTLFVRSASAGR